MKSKKTLSNKEKRDLQTKLIELYGDQVSPSFQKSLMLQSIKTEEGTFIVKDKKIRWFLHDGKHIPSIHLLRELNPGLHKIVVDVGAIRFIINGADVMAPGIAFFDDNITKGDYVVIHEEKANAILGVGISLIDAKEFSKNKKGKVVKLIHHLKDKIWSAKF
ncbi:MAG: PUA domain-containing protein [Candidatus Heimdallarchaeaceae archaeon]